VRGPATTHTPPESSHGFRALLTDTLRLVRSGRSPEWLKSKNPACEAVRREAEEDWGKCSASMNGCLARISGEVARVRTSGAKALRDGAGREAGHGLTRVLSFGSPSRPEGSDDILHREARDHHAARRRGGRVAARSACAAAAAIAPQLGRSTLFARA
jgi:hypothetical protein